MVFITRITILLAVKIRNLTISLCEKTILKEQWTD